MISKDLASPTVLKDVELDMDIPVELGKACRGFKVLAAGTVTVTDAEGTDVPYDFSSSAIPATEILQIKSFNTSGTDLTLYTNLFPVH